MADNVTKFQAATDRDREQLYSLTAHLLRSMKSQPIGNHGPEGYNHGYDVDTIAGRMGDVMSAFGYTAEPPASNETLVADGDNTSVSNTGGSTQGTLNVSGGSLSGVSIADTTALVDDGSTLDVDGVSASISVSAGAQSASLPATNAVVQNGQTATLQGVDVTLGVSGNDLQSLSIPATSTVVSDSDTVDFTDASSNNVNATLAVSGGALDSGSLPATSAVVSDGFTYNDGTNTYTVSVSGGTVTISHAAN